MKTTGFNVQTSLQQGESTAVTKHVLKQMELQSFPFPVLIRE